MKPSSIFAFCASIFLISIAHAAPFYQENFNFDSTNVSGGQDAGRQTSWNAFRSGSRIGVVGFLKVVPGISRLLPAFNSNPSGPDDGYAFWSKDVIGLTIFTDEYTFNVASLARVSYLQRIDGFVTDILGGTIRDGTRFAIRIRGADGNERWYISDLVVPQIKESTWEMVDLDISALTFGIAKLKPDVGPTLPVSGGLTLPPIGVVTAFGVFVDEVRARVRIDNMTLSDRSTTNGIPPQPIPTRAFTPSAPQPTPDPEGETDPDPAQATPTPTATPIPGQPTATPTPSISGTPVVTYGFCTGKPAKSKKAIVAKALRKTIQKSLAIDSQKALRDRAIVSLLITSGIRFDSLENVRVSDIVDFQGVSYLNVYGSEKRPIRLSKNLARFLAEYVQAAALIDKNSPLFRQFTAPNVASVSAVCTGEIAKTLNAALKKAGVVKQVNFVR